MTDAVTPLPSSLLASSLPAYVCDHILQQLFDATFEPYDV
ncbi:hypothetical protein M917_0182 [Psychrobacter aquaticus CMS 56]|uniref:Uncharacterized protein n=1 Tax=Psychrobacter aquaticus CMS 56 TaxID=1354303 RepID=U4T7T9_9GAMM|nr:hypothetical protein M917_0182 [Psychrobacter aquaticus CMS 56]